MKKTITAITLLAGAVAGYSQGTVNFNSYVGGAYVQRIFAPSTGNNTTVQYGGYTTVEEVGSTASGTAPKEKPTGTTVYSGAALTGTGYSVELLAAPGTGMPLSALLPVGAPVGFSTGAQAGLTAVAGQPVSTTTPVVTPTSGGPVTLALAAWNNGGGQWATLLAAQQHGAAWGISPLESLSSTGTTSVPAPNLFGTTTVTYTGLASSFSLGSVPEPSTIALGVMGASALLFRRRK